LAEVFASVGNVFGADRDQELMRTSTPSGFRAAHAAPVYVAAKGTTVSATATTRSKANALLPISDVVVFDGLAGIRSWSPPV